MAIYTQITAEKLIDFLSQYDLGTLDRFEGIEAGVSNTNYHVFTNIRRYVLTLFEPHRVNAKEIPFFLDYVDHLQEKGIPCPQIFKANDGERTHTLCDRPAILSEYFGGDNGMDHRYDADMAGKAGEMIGRVHLTLSDFTQTQKNLFGFEKLQEWYKEHEVNIDTIQSGLRGIIQDELSFQESNMVAGLPEGAIHGDLFPDNFFFDQGDVSGIIDFHFVCTDSYIYDLAIMINAWCFDADGTLNSERFKSMLMGYKKERPFNAKEKEAFPVLLRLASLRFLLSRVDEYLRHDPEHSTMKPHDPLAFLPRLQAFQKFETIEQLAA